MKPRLIYLAVMSCVFAAQFGGVLRPLRRLCGISFTDGH
jgi:hypothetical protein